MLLPSPYPDETIGSLILRAARHSGIPSATLVQEISPSVPLGLGFLSVLRPVKLASVLGMETEVFLIRHTLARVCLSFVQPSVAMRIWHALISEDAVTRSKACWPFPTLCKYRRYCPACIDEDLKMHGESYWHLAHHSPGVVFCLQHGRALLNASHPLYKSHFEYDLTLPHEVTEIQSLPNCKEEALKALHEVAVDALRALWPPRDNWPDEFRSWAIAKGFMPDGHRILTKALSQSLCDFYGMELLRSLLPLRTTFLDGNLAALAALSRPSVYLKGASPISCLLLYGFLKSDSPKTFYEARRSQRDREYALLLQDRVQNHSDSETIPTVQELLEPANGWGYYRHFRDGMPLTRDAVNAYTSWVRIMRRRLNNS